MKTAVIVLFLVALCYCDSDLSGRARNFSIELLYHTQSETDHHAVIAPFGVWSLLTGIAVGATGRSKEELIRAISLPKESKLIEEYGDLMGKVLKPKSAEVTLSSKNFMFIDKHFSVSPDYQNTMTEDFGAMVRNLDFKASDAANIANDIIKGSGAKVSNVLTSNDFKDSRMILSNVISFKGLWASPFNASETAVEAFYDENKKIIGKVNMMTQRAPFPYSSIQEMQSLILELPYGHDDAYCMLVFLPYPKVNVIDVYKNLQKVTFPSIFERLQSDVDNYGLVDVDVKLPRFKISTNVVLNKPLYNMGVYRIFDPAMASFGGITKEEIFVSAIVHKADIEVSESGTVASASTSAMFADRISTPNFHVNRPFLYFVMHKPTTTMIFGGVYSKPTVF